ncbi:MAG: rRNA maturation RNase YbeY [Herpetosiphon sp.]
MNKRYDITIEVDPAYSDELDTSVFETLAVHVLSGEHVPAPASVGIWITNEDQLHELNRTYRNVDRSTDVLSFGDDDETSSQAFVTAPEEPRHLGDIAVSYDHVMQQANDFGHSRVRELSYLICHGLLHLLGYDHEEPDQATTMRQREETHLQELGIPRDAGSR